jgi:hypothetical protein
MARFIRPHFTTLSYYSNISLMCSAGLIIVVFVLLVITHDELRNRIRKFVNVFVVLFNIRKSLSPKVRVRHVDAEMGREIGRVFDL